MRRATKTRPCLVLAIVAREEDGSPIVRVLPITYSPPSNSSEAIEIPAAVKQRLRLDDAGRGSSWPKAIASFGPVPTSVQSTPRAVISGPFPRRCLPSQGWVRGAGARERARERYPNGLIFTEGSREGRKSQVGM